MSTFRESVYIGNASAVVSARASSGQLVVIPSFAEEMVELNARIKKRAAQFAKDLAKDVRLSVSISLEHEDPDSPVINTGVYLVAHVTVFLD